MTTEAIGGGGGLVSSEEVFRPPPVRMLLILAPSVAGEAWAWVGFGSPVYVRVIAVVLAGAGVGIAIRGLFTAVVIGDDFVTVKGVLSNKTFYAEHADVRLQCVSAGIGGDVYQLIMKAEGGRPAVYLPMSLFSARQLRPMTDAVLTALDT